MRYLNFLMAVLCTVLISSSAYAQSFYPNFQLPPPQQLSPLFVGPILGSGIYYGAPPPNATPNKPVIVYVHGFIDLNNLWFAPGNKMYENSFNAGHRCAFVAMTRGQGMWQNGQILAQMLDDITQHYGVNDVVIVAHSNGGKASEVAMIMHNKRSKIDRIISLGTPFGGTELANLSQAPGANILTNVIGLGGGAATSTTYYMGGFARPLLDWHFFNQPSKFINFGAWGYNNGTTLLRPVMTASGTALNWLGSGASVGGNDGVTPFWSSSRRWGKPQWVTGQGNPVSQYDHVDIALSAVMWNDIEPLFTAPLWSLKKAQPTDVVTNASIKSDLQFLSSEDANLSFTIEAAETATEMTILHRSEKDVFQLMRWSPAQTWEPVDLNLQALQQSSPLLEGTSTLLNLSSLDAGKYQLRSVAQFAALVKGSNTVRLELDNSHQFVMPAKATLNGQLENFESYDLTEASLKAILTLTHDLQGKEINKAFSAVETITLQEDGSFEWNSTQSLPQGVYNLVLNAEHPQFQKSLITGFVIHEKTTIANPTNTLSATDLTVFPNPASDYVQLSFETTTAQSQLRLYDVQGRVLHQQLLKDLGQQQVTLDLNALKLNKGTYFVELIDGDKKSTQLFVHH